MHRRRFISRVVGCGFVGGVAGFTTGCGTFLHTERCGQPHSRDIDWKIAALDGLALVLFFVPGVIAFAVDFYTGAIYLPPEPAPGFPTYTPPPPHYPLPPPYMHRAPVEAQPQPAHPYPSSPPPYESPLPANPQGFNSMGLKRIVVPRRELNTQRIEQVVADHLQQNISLEDSKTRVSQLERLDRFADQCRIHRTVAEFGFPMKSFFDQTPRS